MNPAGHARRPPVLGALCAALLVMSASVMAVTVALPSIAADLGADGAELQWITEATVLALASTLIAAGALAERVGERRMLLAGVAVFAAASLLAAAARTPGELIAARALQGIGNAMITPSALAVLRGVFPGPELPRALAAWGAAASAGVVAGPLAGGLLTEHFGWRSVFLVNGAVLLVAGAAIAAVVPAFPGRAVPLDVPGAVLAGGTFVAVVHTLVQAPHRGPLDPATVGGAAAAAASVIAFAVHLRRADRPLIDPGMLARRTFWPAALAAGTGFFALMGVLFLLTRYLQEVRGHSPAEAALSLLPVAAAQLGAAPLAVRSIVRYGVRCTAGGGLAVLAAGAAVMAAGLRTDDPAFVVAGLAVLAAGNAATVNAASTAMLRAAPPGRSGPVAAVTETAFKLGGALGVAVLGGLPAGGALTGGFALAAAVAAGTALGAAALTSLFLRDERRPR
ncbi:MFS transporter [Spirillospora sp. NPDC052242]